MIELTKKHISLVSFGIHAYGSGLKKVVFFGFGHKNPKTTVCLNGLLCYWGSKYIRECGSPYWPVKVIRNDPDGFHHAPTLSAT